MLNFRSINQFYFKAYNSIIYVYIPESTFIITVNLLCTKQLLVKHSAMILKKVLIQTSTKGGIHTFIYIYKYILKLRHISVIFEHPKSAYYQMTAVFLDCARVLLAQLLPRLYSKSKTQQQTCSIYKNNSQQILISRQEALSNISYLQRVAVEDNTNTRAFSV